MMGTPKYFSTNKNMHEYFTDIDILVNFVEFSCMLFFVLNVSLYSQIIYYRCTSLYNFFAIGVLNT